MSKIIDSSYIEISWNEPESLDHPLLRVLYGKLYDGVPSGSILPPRDEIFKDYVKFMSGQIDIRTFILRAGWLRPRDVIRFLKSYAKNNPDSSYFYAGVISNIDFTASRKARYFSYYRDEDYLDKEMGIIIHPGLWNYFNIRHRN